MKKIVVMLSLLMILVSSLVTAHELNVDGYTVALWHMNEGQGEIIFDETQNNHDGTIRGATWKSGKFGKALLFDGIDDYAIVPSLVEQGPQEEVTLEAWIKRNSQDDGMVVSRNGPYYLSVRGNKVEGGVYMGGSDWTDLRGQTEIQVGRWYYIAMTYDGEVLKVYVNGKEDASIPKTGIMPHTGQELFIGWGEPGQNQFFSGTIDEVRVSNISRDNFEFLPKPIKNKDRKKPDKIFRI